MPMTSATASLFTAPARTDSVNWPSVWSESERTIFSAVCSSSRRYETRLGALVLIFRERAYSLQRGNPARAKVYNLAADAVTELSSFSWTVGYAEPELARNFAVLLRYRDADELAVFFEEAICQAGNLYADGPSQRDLEAMERDDFLVQFLVPAQFPREPDAWNYSAREAFIYAMYEQTPWEGQC